MFEDDPDPGTLVETTFGAIDQQTKRSVPSRSRGLLGRRLSGPRGSSGPDDLFEVTIDGVRYVLARRYIDLARR